MALTLNGTSILIPYLKTSSYSPYNGSSRNTTTTPLPRQQAAPPPEISPNIIYAIFIFNGLLALLGLFGNVFVCMIIIRGRKMYTIANLFLMNLAIADMCVLAISYPLWVLQVLLPTAWPFGSALCKIIPSISDAFYGVSLGCMTTISLHRYRMILHAMDKQLTFFQSKVIVVIIWFVSLATISAPLYPVLKYHEAPNGMASCFSVWPNKTYEHIYQMFLCIFWYIFPLLIILFTFLRIKWYLEKQMTYEWLRGSEHTVLVANHIMGIKKALRMLAPVVIVFAILMLPWNIIRMVSIVMEIREIEHLTVYIMVSGTMLVANSVTNPFIYYIMSKEFRMEFKKQWWLLKMKLNLESEDCKYTIDCDKNGRKFVRRTESLFENSVSQVTKPRSDSQLSDYKYSNGTSVNDYESYDEIFRTHVNSISSSDSSDYETLKFSTNNNTVSSGLYSIAEESRSMDIDYSEYIDNSPVDDNDDDRYDRVIEPFLLEQIEEEDLQETRL